MIWGSMSSSGRGNLWFLPKSETMKASNYLKVLQDRLPAMMNVRGTNIFMHDGAPCHKARSVTSWLESQNIEILGPWPGNSPDLNPIENMWHIVKTKVARRAPTGFEDMKKAITDVWCTEITSELCKKMVHSMPSRLREVIRMKGQSIKY